MKSIYQWHIGIYLLDMEFLIGRFLYFYYFLFIMPDIKAQFAQLNQKLSDFMNFVNGKLKNFSNLSLPDSILVKSKISLIIFNRACDEE